MKKVLIILPNGFEIFEASAFIDVLGWANTCGDTSIELIKASISKCLVPTFGCFTISIDQKLDDLNLSDFDAVAIPGGFEQYGYYLEAYSEPVLRALREFDSKGKIIASICVGALPIAKSGVLSGRKATTYHLDHARWRIELAELGALVVDSPIVVDGNIITSTSPGTAIDVAFLLLEFLTSKQNCQNIRTLMGF